MPLFVAWTGVPWGAAMSVPPWWPPRGPPLKERSSPKYPLMKTFPPRGMGMNHGPAQRRGVTVAYNSFSRGCSFGGGGGPGGATAAKYIARDSQGAIAVTLVEENETYQTCFHSNLYVGGFKTYEEISHRYDALTKNHGITLARARATQIDRDKKEVVLSTGQRLPYDRLVVSPGIDLKYDSVPGWSKEVEPSRHGRSNIDRDSIPKLTQSLYPPLWRIADDKRSVDGTDRDTNNPAPPYSCFDEAFIYTGLIGSERTTALQQ